MTSQESVAHRHVGTRLTRRDAAERLAGRTLYTEDIRPDGLLHAVLVVSPMASALLRGIDTSRAEAVDGVVAVLTAADVTDRRYGNYVEDQPILARGRVRFVGEPIAMVAATSLAAARQAASLVVLDLEELPHVVDLEQALEQADVLVHDGVSNVLEDVRIARGDVDDVFRASHAVVSTDIESHRVHHAYLEPRAVTAVPKPGGGLSLIMSTQQPFGVRHLIAKLFDLPTGSVEVDVPAVGGGFGGKLHLQFAPQACAMALATGRPVQLVCTRDEDMVTGNPRENSIVRLSSAVDEQGRILARRCDLILDAGAYALDTPILTSMAAFYATGPYRIDALDIRGRAVYTHTCPTGSFRGPSGPQMVYAVEAHMDDIAERLGLDATEVRRRNFIAEGDLGPTGEPVTVPASTDECLRVVEDRIAGWRAAAPAGDRRPRGYGLACAWWSTLGTPSAATVEMHEDGTATLRTGGTEIGTGAISTALPAMVAEELGLELDEVVLRSGSTSDAPYESGSRGSRTMFAAGNATLLATREVVAQIKAEAARLMDVDPADLELRDGRVRVAGDPEAGLALAEVARSAHLHSGPVAATSRYRAELSVIEGSVIDGARFLRLGEPTFHCHGVEIALDPETGDIEVLNYVAVHDVGHIVNPVGARGQVEGGVVQGIGYALTEQLTTDARGRIINGNLHDYRIPTIADAPASIETVFVETHASPRGPFGAKGLGEPPVILPAAALGSAVRDILGAQPYRLPLDPERMVAAVAVSAPGRTAPVEPAVVDDITAEPRVGPLGRAARFIAESLEGASTVWSRDEASPPAPPVTPPW